MKIRTNQLFAIHTLVLLSILLWTCQSKNSPDTFVNPFESIHDTKAKQLLQKAVEKAGGLSTWQNLQELHFQKHFLLLDSNGTAEQNVLQQHDYIFGPKREIKISWVENEAFHEIKALDQEVAKTINGAADTLAKPTSLKNTVLSATFVISIPFNLLDEGAELSYAGQDTLEDNRVVEVLKVAYNPEKHANHSTPDTWWHYFDHKDYTHLGYMVQHADHYSYVRNLSFLTEGGILFPKERESYRVDNLRNILYLRAKYLYKDYTLK